MKITITKWLFFVQLEFKPYLHGTIDLVGYIYYYVFKIFQEEVEKMAEKIVLSFGEYLRLQVKFALEPENRWYAGEKLGHSPTDEEAVRYFAEGDGSKNFADQYIPEIFSSPEKKST